MIVDPRRTTVISSLGWIERDAVWRYEAATGQAATIPLASGARYLSVHSSGGGLFAAVHHFDEPRCALTVHTFDQPAKIVARVDIDGGIASTGDARAWEEVPSLFVAFLAGEPWRDYVLIRVRSGTPSLQRFAWFDRSYDKDYQGIVDALALPDGDTALVSVARSSDLIVHDLATGAARRTVRLSGHMGNPRPQWRPGTDEIWAVDYDTLVALDSRTWQVRRQRRLQDPAGNTAQFVGDISFNADGRCLVPRPFSGDAVTIDPESLDIVGRAVCAGKPLEAVTLADGEVVARDWQSGALQRGRQGRDKQATT